MAGTDGRIGVIGGRPNRIEAADKSLLPPVIYGARGEAIAVPGVKELMVENEQLRARVAALEQEATGTLQYLVIAVRHCGGTLHIDEVELAHMDGATLTLSRCVATEGYELKVGDD